MPHPVEIRGGDIVLVPPVELYHARVERAGALEVVIQPLNPRIPDRRVRLREVRRVFRDVGTPSAAPGRLLPSPRNLRFDDLDGHGGSR